MLKVVTNKHYGDLDLFKYSTQMVVISIGDMVLVQQVCNAYLCYIKMNCAMPFRILSL